MRFTDRERSNGDLTSLCDWESRQGMLVTRNYSWINNKLKYFIILLSDVSAEFAVDSNAFSPFIAPVSYK